MEEEDDTNLFADSHLNKSKKDRKNSLISLIFLIKLKKT